MHKEIPDYRKDIFRLWLNWVIGRGLLSLLILLPLWFKPIYLPIFAFSFQALMLLTIKHYRPQNPSSCYILPFIMSRVFFWTGIALLAIILIHRMGLGTLVFDETNIMREIPFIILLITNLICAIISGLGYLRRRKMAFCHECELRHGSPAERGLLGLILAQIGHFQVSLLFWVSAVIASVGWSYYLLVYSSEYISVPDRFVFYLLPTMVFIATTIYLALRYIGIYTYYKQNVIDRVQYRENASEIRFLLINGDRIAVREPNINADFMMSLDDKCDTAVKANIHRIQTMTTMTASQYFSNLSGIRHADIRPMFVNELPQTNNYVYHYFAIVDDEQRAEYDKANPDVEWLTLQELAPMLNSGMFASMFAAEIVRFHTIASAFKTYDNHGMRRYKIKHYRPAVRFSDVINSDVDFNDSTWLYIADNNQDTPFFRLRNFYRKYILGLSI